MPIGSGTGTTFDLGTLWDSLESGTKSSIIRTCGFDPDENLGSIPWEQIPENAQAQLRDAYLMYDTDTGD